MTKVISSPFPSKAIKTIDANTDAIIVDLASAGVASEANQLLAIAELQDIEADIETGNSKLEDVKTKLDTLIAKNEDGGNNSKSYTHSYDIAPISAWTLVGTLTASCEYMHIFDSSGEVIEIGTGEAGSEVPFRLIPRGGDNFKLNMPSGTKLSVRGYNGITLNVGEIIISTTN